MDCGLDGHGPWRIDEYLVDLACVLSCSTQVCGNLRFSLPPGSNRQNSIDISQDLKFRNKGSPVDSILSATKLPAKLFRSKTIYAPRPSIEHLSKRIQRLVNPFQEKSNNSNRCVEHKVMRLRNKNVELRLGAPSSPQSSLFAPHT